MFTQRVVLSLILLATTSASKAETQLTAPFGFPEGAATRSNDD